MQTKEICWNITTKCNQNCRYCHRFLNIPQLTIEENRRILTNLISGGVTDLTWTGGEPLLYDGLDELMKLSHEKGIKNKLITNGSLLSEQRIQDLIGYLDSLTLSIDSIDPKVNGLLGRGENHFNNIDRILRHLKEMKSPAKLRINTVINSLSSQGINDLISYLAGFKIDCWRVFKFIPLRETAIKNESDLSVTDDAFDAIKSTIIVNSNIKKVEFVKKEDLESKYVLIVANGDIIITENGSDKKIGNALVDNISKFLQRRVIVK